MSDNCTKSLRFKIRTTYCRIRLNRRPSWVFQILCNHISLNFDPFILPSVGKFYRKYRRTTPNNLTRRFITDLWEPWG